MENSLDLENIKYFISVEEFSFLCPKRKRDYIISMVNKGYHVYDEILTLASDKTKQDYAIAIAISGYGLTKNAFSLISQKTKEDYFYIKKMKRLFSNNKSAFERFKTLIIKKYKLNV